MAPSIPSPARSCRADCAVPQRYPVPMHQDRHDGLAETVALVSPHCTEKAALTPLVVDPVLIATRGAILGDDSVLTACDRFSCRVPVLSRPNYRRQLGCAGSRYKHLRTCFMRAKRFLDMGGQGPSSSKVVMAGRMPSPICCSSLIRARGRISPAVSIHLIPTAQAAHFQLR